MTAFQVAVRPLSAESSEGSAVGESILVTLKQILASIEQRNRLDISRSSAVVKLQSLGIDPLISIRDWEDLLGLSTREISRMVSSGRLPKPDSRFGKLPRWRTATVRRYLEQLK